jgi:regulator of sigma E protease
MTILLFIIMLVVLIVGHEFGHLIAAKLSKMKVPEFGIGFPPKLWGKKIGDTEYTVNALPFGGFVKIVGEDPSKENADDPDAFYRKPKFHQAATLVAGPFANIVLAFVFLSVAFMVGIPSVVNPEEDASNLANARVMVTEVLADSPAADAGLKAGDHVVSLAISGSETQVTRPQEISDVVEVAGEPVSVSILRGGEPLTFEITPEAGVIAEEPEKKALGIASASVGTLRLGFFEAIGHAFMETGRDAFAVFLGLISLIASAATLSVDGVQVAGPVGIASLAGDAASFGFGSFLSFAALISINLAILNLLPFPALDGGRLAFLAVETVMRRPIPAAVANGLNFAGFAILILLMLAVTANDIVRLVT